MAFPKEVKELALKQLKETHSAVSFDKTLPVFEELAKEGKCYKSVYVERKSSYTVYGYSLDSKFDVKDKYGL